MRDEPDTFTAEVRLNPDCKVLVPITPVPEAGRFTYTPFTLCRQELVTREITVSTLRKIKLFHLHVRFLVSDKCRSIAVKLRSFF
jgi:hypothetical protein